MRLTEEQIRSVAFGAVCIQKEERGLRFYKCTRKQIEAWAAKDAGLGERAAGCTGVRLDFHTDSDHIRFKAFGGTFELLVNDLVTHRFPAGEGAEFSASLEKGEKRITLLFPSHGSEGGLEWVELEDGATLQPHQYARKILFIGDSITQGWNSDFDSCSYAWRVSRKLNAESVINGIGGAYYLEDSFDPIDFAPDTVVVAYGTNDYGHYKTQEELQKECSGFLNKIKEYYGEKKVFIILPPWRFDLEKVRPMGSFEDCRRIIQSEGEARGFTVIDGFQLVPHLEFFFADALHPNAIGFAEYAKNLIRFLEQ